MTVGDKIRAAREAAGLTQEELGKRCGTTKQTIYKYEIGKITNIPLDRLEAIAEIVGVPAVSLLGWDSSETSIPKEDGRDDLDDQISKFIKLLTREQKQLLLAQLRVLTGD